MREISRLIGVTPLWTTKRKSSRFWLEHIKLTGKNLTRGEAGKVLSIIVQGLTSKWLLRYYTEAIWKLSMDKTGKVIIILYFTVLHKQDRWVLLTTYFRRKNQIKIFLVVSIHYTHTSTPCDIRLLRSLSVYKCCLKKYLQSILLILTQQEWNKYFNYTIQ